MNRIIKETGIGVLSGIESYPPGYEGEITVHLKNFKPTMQMLDIAMPIARMVLRKVEDVSFVSSDETFIKKENKDNSKEDENENTNKNDTPGSDNPEKSKSD